MSFEHIFNSVEQLSFELTPYFCWGHFYFQLLLGPSHHARWRSYILQTACQYYRFPFVLVWQIDRAYRSSLASRVKICLRQRLYPWIFAGFREGVYRQRLRWSDFNLRAQELSRIFPQAIATSPAIFHLTWRVHRVLRSQRNLVGRILVCLLWKECSRSKFLVFWYWKSTKLSWRLHCCRRTGSNSIFYRTRSSFPISTGHSFPRRKYRYLHISWISR